MTDLIDPYAPSDPMDWPAEMERLRAKIDKMRNVLQNIVDANGIDAAAIASKSLAEVK